VAEWNIRPKENPMKMKTLYMKMKTLYIHENEDALHNPKHGLNLGDNAHLCGSIA
jgi:hypothetical protein